MIGFKPYNEVLDALLINAMSAPANAVVPVPWSKRLGLGVDGRLAAIAAIKSGDLGLARNISSKGVERYALYYGRSRAGNWFAKVLPAWLAALYATVLAALIFPGLLPSGSYTDALIASGAVIISFFVFVPRAILSMGSHGIVAGASARSNLNSSFVIVIAMAVFTLGAAWGIGGKLIENSITLYLVESFYSANAIPTLLLKVFAGSVGVSYLVVLPAAFLIYHGGLNRLGAVRIGKAIGESKERVPVVKEMYDKSHTKLLETKDTGAGAVMTVFGLMLAGLLFIGWLVK